MELNAPPAIPSRHAGRRRSAGGQLLRSRAGRLLRWLVPRLVVLLSRLLVRSSRIEVVGREHEDAALARSGQIIFAGLHEGMMLLPYHFRDRARGLVMVSRSRDGDLIADTIERFGLCAVRGSSGRGGGDALREMADRLGEGSVSAGIIVDGPRGPARVAKSGAVVLARATGLPIVPGTWWARPALRVGSWDRTLVPLPFAHVAFVFEEPLWIAPGTTDAELERYRDELTRRLDAARVRARRLCGSDETTDSP